MDNSNDNDKTIDNITSTQTDVPDADEPIQPERVMEPADTGEETDEDIARDDEASLPAESGAEESVEPSQDPVKEPSQPERIMEPADTGEDTDKDIARDDEESVAEESGAEESVEPSQDPVQELSPDEVRTALVAIRGQNRSAHFNAGEHTLKQGDEVVIQTEHG